jgi:Lon protease-like protein
MSENPYAPEYHELPETVPIFPLHGVLLLPRGQLPLNVFEDKYLAMVQDVMRSHRMIGMVQPESPQTSKLFRTGCAGKVTGYQETDDGRNLVTLTGICRFEIAAEMDTLTPYRVVEANWSSYRSDLGREGCTNLDRERLTHLLKTYFEIHEFTCSWEHIEQATDERLITCLSMICPLEANEKQALLEADSCADRGEKFLAMLEMAVKGASSGQFQSSEPH